MAKNLSDPTQRNVGGIDDSDGQRKFGSNKSYQGGGRGHIASGPAPGGSGVARGDSAVGRSTGTSRDLTGAPKAPRR
jgi:hypothetical protein